MTELPYVYDTAEITARRVTELSEDFVVPRKVMEEVKKGFLAKKIMSIEETLQIIDPDEESRLAARKGAEETGDLEVLSEADLDVIAVAVMIGGTVVSDDFAVQNTCVHLGVPVQGSTLGLIRKEIKWVWRCTGCRKIYKKHLDQCPVCGHDLKRLPRSERNL